MRAADLLFWLWRALLAGRSRSLLSALGIAIGIASVTLLTGIGEGLRLYLLDSFSQFGTRLIAVTPGKTETAGGPPGILSSSRSSRSACCSMSGDGILCITICPSSCAMLKRRPEPWEPRWCLHALRRRRLPYVGANRHLRGFCVDTQGVLSEHVGS